MSQYKTKHAVYTAWNYQQEITDLNAESVKGWQLIHGGCFNSKFEKDEGVIYRYQIDYDPNIENRVRYVETFREQGWEYINSTFNGWHYFRKIYDASLPEEEYEIYTDDHSQVEMSGRWTRMATVILCFMVVILLAAICRMIQLPELARIPIIVMYGAFASLLGRGLYVMKATKGLRSRRGGGKGFVITIVIALVGLVAMEALIMTKPSRATNTYAEEFESIPEGETMNFDQFEVKYTDFYYLDLKMEMGAPICFSILRETGETVYEITESSYEKENIRLKLKPGFYKIQLSDFDGGKLELHYTLD